MRPSTTNRLLFLTVVVFLSMLTPAAWTQIVQRRQTPNALVAALDRDDARTIVALVERGADLRTRDHGGQTVFHWAVRRGRIAYVRELLGRGAEINALGGDRGQPRWCSFEPEHRRTPLMIAARRGDLAMVRLLLARGADTQIADEYGNRAIFHAAWELSIPVVLALLQHGGDPAVRNHLGRSLLHVAAIHRSTALAKAVLAKGCPVNARDEGGNTALMEAADEGDITTIRHLLAAGADRTLKNKAGKSAWGIALEAGHGGRLGLLATAADSRQSALDARLIHAVVQGDANRARALLQWGAKPNARNRSGIPMLLAAAAGGSLPVVSLLLEKGANPNVRGPVGSTPLMEAARSHRRHVGIIRALIAHGADLNAVDDQGETAVAMAARDGDAALVAALADAGADLTGKGAFAPPLWWAAASGHADVVKHLLSRGVDPHGRNRDGSTAIDQAEMGGHTRIVTLLKRAGGGL